MKKLMRAIRSLTPASWMIILALLLIVVQGVLITRLQRELVAGDDGIIRTIRQLGLRRDGQLELLVARIQALEAQQQSRAGAGGGR